MTFVGKLVAVAKQNTFQRSLAAVSEQFPIFGFIVWHSKLVQKLGNVCTVHQVFLFKQIYIYVCVCVFGACTYVFGATGSRIA